MTDTTGAFGKVADYLRQVSAPRIPGMPITLDTEIHGDLRLYGDDLWELSLWLHREFGVEGTFIPARHGPPETNFAPIVAMLRRVLGFKDPQYESLTVSHVLTAIEAKRWPSHDD